MSSPRHKSGYVRKISVKAYEHTGEYPLVFTIFQSPENDFYRQSKER